jgi:hypothetical protein
VIDDLPPQSHRLRPDHLPTPFSADQIRDTSEIGRQVRVRDEVLGESPTYRQITLIAADAAEGTRELVAIDETGAAIGPPTLSASTWVELQHHASKPADRTVITVEDLDLSWGAERCWLYVVRDGADERRFWFARSMPGMPVRVEAWINGVMTERSEVISVSAPR